MVKIKDIPKHPALFLTQPQRELYYEQGYLTFPALIPHSELTELRLIVDGIVDNTRRVTESGNEIDLEKVIPRKTQGFVGLPMLMTRIPISGVYALIR